MRGLHLKQELGQSQKKGYCDKSEKRAHLLVLCAPAL